MVRSRRLAKRTAAAILAVQALAIIFLFLPPVRLAKPDSSLRNSLHRSPGRDAKATRWFVVAVDKGAPDRGTLQPARRARRASALGKPRSATAPPCEDRAHALPDGGAVCSLVLAEHGRQAEHAQPDLVEDAVGQDARQRCQQLRIAACAIAYLRLSRSAHGEWPMPPPLGRCRGSPERRRAARRRGTWRRSAGVPPAANSPLPLSTPPRSFRWPACGSSRAGRCRP